MSLSRIDPETFDLLSVERVPFNEPLLKEMLCRELERLSPDDIARFEKASLIVYEAAITARFHIQRKESKPCDGTSM